MSTSGVKVRKYDKRTSMVKFRWCGNSRIQHSDQISCLACVINVTVSVRSCPAYVFSHECPRLWMWRNVSWEKSCPAWKLTKSLVYVSKRFLPSLKPIGTSGWILALPVKLKEIVSVISGPACDDDKVWNNVSLSMPVCNGDMPSLTNRQLKMTQWVQALPTSVSIYYMKVLPSLS